MLSGGKCTSTNCDFECEMLNYVSLEHRVGRDRNVKGLLDAMRMLVSERNLYTICNAGNLQAANGARKVSRGSDDLRLLYRSSAAN